mmetsp:Transcript_21789/g.51865  ORF Transcript_21789/g.51865 Transcript_21789/m.51865 type:complete len:172 (+) Transcript_21789:310-825(+)|eukprot:CAMPEP_0197179418 /NCGR_PEP_ID=MMETSP1423-20130617/4378_1 /TAXON_ID=476441 /ORGANISM="Pseudo-nitzschia heimii, Strain UNC1101" /LENGTH=171 /DNA_ID=CAMNT_0042629329 /DNA_START=301 /DNA_END=816 /DNA_ORIENTATION=+
MPDAEATTADAPPAVRSKKAAVHWQEVQDTVSRLASHKGVLAIAILNGDGDIVTQQITSAGASRKTTLSGAGGGGGNNNGGNVLGNPKLLAETMKNANGYVRSLSGHDDDGGGAAAASGETDPDEAVVGETPKPKEDISFVRIRTRKDEILVAPKMGYTLVVLQDPSLSSL